jgi:ferric-dicitrate binding protein FerR (iron transport regulator)
VEVPLKATSFQMQKMTKQEFQDLLDRYFNGIVSDDERQLIDNFYNKLQESEEGWEAFSEEAKKQIRTEIYDAIQRKKREKEAPARSIRSWIWKVAASIVFVLGVGITYYINQPVQEINYLTKSTSKGQKATITLSDGSTVRLNAQSSITYPENFAEELRELELIGEAFFDITKDKDRPFIVSSHKIQTTVLGTTFNINAYDSAAVSVALVSGKVKVNATPDNQSFNQSEVYLNPGESAFYVGRSGDINIETFDEKKLVAWKDGIIYLSDAGYKQVFDQLSRWYGVEFEFANVPTKQWDYSGEFKDMSLELVLNTIGYSKGFEFEIHDDRVNVQFEN